MLTVRGYSLLIAVAIQMLFALGSTENGAPVALLGLTVLAWFGYEWIKFLARARIAFPKLLIVRSINDTRRSIPVVRVGKEFEVHLEIRLESAIPFDYLVIDDRVPLDVQIVDGSPFSIASLSREEVLDVRYRIRCLAPGELRFEGVRVQLGDAQGFFHKRAFLRSPLVVPVIPPNVDVEGKRRTTKRDNALPAPGVHRYLRPGGGTELLDLRDYRAGDPPKMIAWKPSAKRDTLIVREYESEVPLKVSMFVDTSQSVRLGPPRRNMLVQLVGVAAGVAQATIDDRDLIGLTLFDERGIEVVRPARSRTHLIGLIRKLSADTREGPMNDSVDPNVLTESAMGVALELYPDLMDRKVNRISRNPIPFSMFWRPALDTKWGRVITILLSPIIFLFLLVVLMGFALFTQEETVLKSLFAVAIAVWKVVGLFPQFWIVLVSFLGALGLFLWLVIGVSGHVNPRYLDKARRKRLALLYATLDGAPAETIYQYMQDDRMHADRTTRFLSEHHARIPVTLYDKQGRYLFRGVGKLRNLNNSLRHAVARAKDQELFVVLADLIELRDVIGETLMSIRIAMGRKHEVVVIVPWMPDIPVPNDEDLLLTRTQLRRKRTEMLRNVGMRGMALDIMRDVIERYHESWYAMRSELTRVGVTVMRADVNDSTQQILDRMEILRRIRRR